MSCTDAHVEQREMGMGCTCPPSDPAPKGLRRFLFPEEVPWAPDLGRVDPGKLAETASVPYAFSLQPWSLPLEAQATAGAAASLWAGAATAAASPMVVAAGASVPPVAVTWVAAPPACASSLRRRPPRRVIEAKEPHLPLLPPPPLPTPPNRPPVPNPKACSFADTPCTKSILAAKCRGSAFQGHLVHPSASRQVLTEGPH